MSFTLPDLLVEGAIRAGYDLLRGDSRDAILDVVFDFTEFGVDKDGGLPSSVFGKYTQEAQRVKDFFAENEVAIVQSYSDVQTQLPCISIQLANDGEDQGLALADDFGGVNGEVLGPDLNIIHANTVINVGIHSKEQLLTKYMYHLTKYFILSAKIDLIRQNFIIATFRGSDFSRDNAWQGDHVYTRFLNISGKTEDSWINLDEVLAGIEQVNVGIIVPTDTVQFNNPSSEVNSSLTAGATMIQVANSFYLGTGVATLITQAAADGEILATEVINITANDTTTNILTVDAITLDHLVNPDPLNRVITSVVKGTDLTQSQTVQSRPDSLLIGGARANNNDEDDTIHRTTSTGVTT